MKPRSSNSLVVWRRFVVGVDANHPLDGFMSRLLQLFALPVLASVQPLSIRRVDGFRGRRPAMRKAFRGKPGWAEETANEVGSLGQKTFRAKNVNSKINAGRQRSLHP